MRAIKLAVGSVFLLTAIGFAQNPPVSAPATSKSGTADAPASLNKTSLEELLGKALQHSPEVQVAEAKMREAEALLRQTRLQIAQKIVEIHTTAEQQQRLLSNVESEYKRMVQLHKSGGISSAEISDVERKLLAVKNQVAQLDNTVNALTGRFPALAHEVEGKFLDTRFMAIGNGGGGAGAGLGGSGQEPKLRHPSPAMSEKIRKSLAASIKLPEKGFEGVPLREVFDFVRKSTPSVPIMIHLSNKADEQVTLDFRGDLTVAGLFQLLSDTVPNLQVIVRDYGFLVTQDGSVPEDGMKVIDFWEAQLKGA